LFTFKENVTKLGQFETLQVFGLADEKYYEIITGKAFGTINF